MKNNLQTYRFSFKQRALVKRNFPDCHPVFLENYNITERKRQNFNTFVQYAICVESLKTLPLSERFILPILIRKLIILFICDLLFWCEKVFFILFCKTFIIQKYWYLKEIFNCYLNLKKPSYPSHLMVMCCVSVCFK